MNPQKDIHNGNNQNQQSFTRSQELSESVQSRLSVGEQGLKHPIFLRKVERLSAGVYLVTEHFSLTEPLKDKLRSKSLELISLSLVGQPSSFPDQDRAFVLSKNIVREVVSLLNIAATVGLISPMNFKILTEEYAKLAELIDGRKKNLQDFILPHDFFIEQQNEVTGAIQKPQPVPANTKGHVKDTNDNYSSLVQVKKTNNDVSAKINRPSSSSTKEQSSIRRKSITEALLASSRPLNIKDFSRLIKNCSEKTIQRELSAMVSDKILIKEGERRWSTYRLSDKPVF